MVNVDPYMAYIRIRHGIYIHNNPRTGNPILNTSQYHGMIRPVRRPLPAWTRSEIPRSAARGEGETGFHHGVHADFSGENLWKGLLQPDPVVLAGLERWNLDQ